MKDILNYLIGGGFLAILIPCFIEIVPCRINPIGWLGKRFNAGLQDDLQSLKKDIAQIQSNTEVDKTDACRRRILRFDDEVRHKVRHTEEHFNEIIDDIKNYELYCNAHPDYQNDKCRFAIDKIRETYKKCRNENDFLI